MRRSLLWLVTIPFAGVSVLVGHWAAYSLAGAPADNFHGYLAHAPQVVVILATLALIGLARDSRAQQASPVPLALLGTFAFVVQEHLERLVHTGQVPFLLTSPVFLLGIALQLPLAAVIWLATRTVAGRLRAVSRRPPPLLALLPLVLAPVPARLPRAAVAAAPRGRGPPLLLQ